MTSSQIQAQTLGLTLAVVTAVGCLSYERLVKAYSLTLLVAFNVSFYVVLFVVLYARDPKVFHSDIISVFKAHPLSALIYWLTFVTTPIWYVITRKQSVIAGSLYEMKYIILLAVFYAFCGEGKFSLNLGLGFVFTMLALYFISKT